MTWGRHSREWIAVASLVAGVVFFIASLNDTRSPGDTRREARRVERVLERRAAQLDAYAAKALAQNPSDWMQLEGLPQDFVLYRYCSDTLQSWCHEFPVSNDNINRRVYVPFVADPRISAESPLLQVTDSLGFHNLGPSWYLAKWVGDGNVRVLAGIEVQNRSLRLQRRYTIRPLSVSGGSVVSVQGRPQFKILLESLSASGRDASPLLWISIGTILLAFLLFLSSKRSPRRFGCVTLGVLILLAGLYFWGRFSGSRVLVFSPMLYAGGDVLYSLGAVILINLAILMCAACAYMVRRKLWAWMNTRPRRIAVLVGVLLLAAGVIIYSQSALRSIALNSGFSLEIYKLGQLSPFCVIVYLSFISMLISVPLLLQLAAPALRHRDGRSFDAFSLSGRVLYAVLVATYLVVTAGVLGFQKEKDRLGLLANRLSFLSLIHI